MRGVVVRYTRQPRGRGGGKPRRGSMNVDWLVQGHIHKQERDFIGVDGSGVASHSKEHLNGWECSYLYMPRGGANLVGPI